ncbi:MAG: PQQ-binding-like beta-propeller repeat protein [bacterium]
MRRKVLIFILMIVTLGQSFSQLANSAWPTFRHDIQNTGKSLFNGPENPIKKWSFNTGNYIRSSPAISTDGTIYVGSGDKKIYAIKPDGSELWNYNVGAIIEWSSPTVCIDGSILIGSYDKKLYSINSNGSKKWEFLTGDQITSSPVITSDGSIYFGSGDNKLYALNIDGSKKWEFTTGGRIGSTPAIGKDGTIYFGSLDKKLYALSPNGTKKWEFVTGNWVYSSPSIDSNGTIYFGSGDNKLYALNPNGTKKWEFTTGDQIDSVPAIDSDGTIYVGSYDNKLYAINPDGTKKWEFITGNQVNSSPLISADGTIFVGSSDKKMYAINKNGSKKWEYSSSDKITSSPSLGSDGTLYFSSEDHNLYAITNNNSISSLTLISPNGNEQWLQSSTHNITWTSTGNPGNVKIELFKNSVLNSTISNNAPNTGTYSWNIPTNQTLGTDYRVKITSLTDVNVSDNSDADFTIIADSSTRFGVPVQISPTNNAVNVAIPATLVWLPVSTAVNYQYELYGPASASIPIETNTVNTTSATIQYNLNTNTKYTWRVQAINSSNIHSAYSTFWSFTTAMPQLLPPTLISPADNAIDVPINTTFVWTSVLNSLAYDVEISKDANFTNRVSLGSPTTTLTTLLAYSTKYYWRARGKNGNNLGLWSTIFTFTTADFVPTSGIDSAIRNSKLGSPTFGVGVINNTGNLQTVTIDQEINRQSEFDIMIKNTGNVPDIFLITSSTIIDNGLNSKWKVAIFDDSGIDRTSKIFNNGWTSYNIKPGQSVILRLRLAASSKQIIDESNPPKQSVSIIAQSMNDIKNGAATPASDTVIGVAYLIKRSNLN